MPDMEIKPSQIVKSLAGHDKGRFYHVLRVEGEFAILVDGRVRRLQNPKRKKLKHLVLMGGINSPAAEKIAAMGDTTNRELIKSLAAFRGSRQSTEEGENLGKR